MATEKVLHFNGSLVQTADHLSVQPVERLLFYGHQVNRLLKELGGEHTFHPSPMELAGSMKHRHAVVLTDEDGLEVHGAVRATPWIVTDDINKKGDMIKMSPLKALENGDARIAAIEIGSLVIHKDEQRKKKGRQLVDELCKEIANSYLGVPRVAVVTNDNAPSLHVFDALHWVQVSTEDACRLLGIDILDGWEPESTIFVDPSSIQLKEKPV